MVGLVCPSPGREGSESLYDARNDPSQMRNPEAETAVEQQLFGQREERGHPI